MRAMVIAFVVVAHLLRIFIFLTRHLHPIGRKYVVCSVPSQRVILQVVDKQWQFVQQPAFRVPIERLLGAANR